MTTFRNKPEEPKRSSYKFAFVDLMPDVLDEGVLYVCVGYATAAHKCFCGCGREVVTPIHPTKWRLTFDGVHVSLFPSVGSWSLPCQSHYWLKNGRVSWATKMSDAEIRLVRQRDLAAQDHYFGEGDEPTVFITTPSSKPASVWRKVSSWLQGK